MRRDEGGVDVDDERCAGIDPWSGAWSPASRHAAARACARAVWIARNATVGSVASRSTVRDTVGSDATSP